MISLNDNNSNDSIIMITIGPKNYGLNQYSNNTEYNIIIYTIVLMLKIIDPTFVIINYKYIHPRIYNNFDFYQVLIYYCLCIIFLCTTLTNCSQHDIQKYNH